MENLVLEPQLQADLDAVLNRGVKSAYVREDGHLIFVMSDNQEVDLGDIQGPVMEAVKTYIEEHAVTVDDTLTVSGAAADAAAVGVRFGDMESRLERFQEKFDETDEKLENVESAAQAAADMAADAAERQEALEQALLQKIEDLGSSRVAKSGDTMTGSLDLGGNDLQNVGTAQLQVLALLPPNDPDGELGVNAYAEAAILGEDGHPTGQVLSFYGIFNDEPAVLRNVHDPVMDTDAVPKGYLEQRLAGKITAPETAAVGQVLAVEAVDDDGQPVSWVPVDPPSGGSAATGAVKYDTAQDLTTEQQETARSNIGAQEIICYDSRERKITFDGNLEGKTHVVSFAEYSVKISDIPLTKDEMLGARVSFTENGEDREVEITEDSINTDYAENAILAEAPIISVFADTVIDDVAFTPGLWVMYIPDEVTVNSVVYAPADGKLQQIPAKYIPLPAIEELLNGTLVAAGKTEFSTNAPAVISPAQDTPRLKAGKCYDVYVDGVLQYTATCDYGKLWRWESANEYLVLVDPRGSGYQKIAECISDNKLFAVTDSGLPWSEQGLALEIYEVEQIPEKHLKNAVTSVNGKKGNVTLSADDVGALPADTEIPKVPDTLPNPNALTVNGVTYDGSKGVNIDTKELPKVDEDDDGKILGVSGGAWGKMDFPSVGGGEAGGYYTPAVSQPEAGSMEISFDASSGEMPEVAPVLVALPQGEKGDTGADGYTPVKGVDYFTADDKNELVQAVLAALPAAEEGSF